MSGTAVAVEEPRDKRDKDRGEIGDCPGFPRPSTRGRMRPNAGAVTGLRGRGKSGASLVCLSDIKLVTYKKCRMSG